MMTNTERNTFWAYTAVDSLQICQKIEVSRLLCHALHEQIGPEKIYNHQNVIIRNKN